MNDTIAKWAKRGMAVYVACALFSCSAERQIGKRAGSIILLNPAFATAHVGISIFDVKANRYLYNYQGDKLFVPASNTKLFTCYAALKYLGDSVPAAYYTINNNQLILQTTGDPTFLHPDFDYQPLFELMKQPRFSSVELYTNFAAKALGRGWAWDDFASDYMAERDPFPMYGNLATFKFVGDTLTTVPPTLPVIGKPVSGQPWQVSRDLGGHFFIIDNNTGSTDSIKTLTLAKDQGAFAETFLQDTLDKTVHKGLDSFDRQKAIALYSQPLDSFLSITMKRSDNFFAEQTLLMVSDKMLGQMNDEAIIDTLLKTDFKQLPQQPKWVDGSGLSRYNLFSPQNFVWLLGKMKTDFGFDRVKAILPKGDEGTLKGLYKQNPFGIFAKTGTLSNNVALSGYLLTKNNRTLIFSILVNNHTTSPGNIRKSIEQFLTGLIDRY